MEYLLVFMFLTIPVLGAVAAFLKLREVFIFKYDSSNPYRRICRKCNQEQNEYGEYFTDPKGWWEDVGEECNPHCVCHFYSRNY